MIPALGWAGHWAVRLLRLLRLQLLRLLRLLPIQKLIPALILVLFLPLRELDRPKLVM
jgi:hypothetical protein